MASDGAQRRIQLTLTSDMLKLHLSVFVSVLWRRRGYGPVRFRFRIDHVFASGANMAVVPPPSPQTPFIYMWLYSELHHFDTYCRNVDMMRNELIERMCGLQKWTVVIFDVMTMACTYLVAVVHCPLEIASCRLMLNLLFWWKLYALEILFTGATNVASAALLLKFL